MIINSSQISMDASVGHKDVSKTAKGQILTRNHSGRTSPHFTLKLPNFKNLQASELSNSLIETSRSNSSFQENDQTLKEDQQNKQIISQVVSSVTGTPARIREFDPNLFQVKKEAPGKTVLSAAKRFYQIGGKQFSLTFSSTKVQYEYEYYHYNSHGTVITEDGRQVNFSLDLSVQRTSVARQSIFSGTHTNYMIDPLVLHFDNKLDNLFEQPFLFDLTGDGNLETISGMRPGSGFLALDMDDDKIISSGRELFGPLSGSGFSDLAIHDHDNNNWIDENDPIFEKLLVWMNPSGRMQELLSLKEAGVGAISLSNTNSLFNLKSPKNILLGQVAASGLFLTEEGEVKSLQDIHFNISGNKSSSKKDTSLASLRSVVEEHRETLSALMNQDHLKRFKRDDENQDRWSL